MMKGCSGLSRIVMRVWLVVAFLKESVNIIDMCLCLWLVDVCDVMYAHVGLCNKMHCEWICVCMCVCVCLRERERG